MLLRYSEEYREKRAVMGSNMILNGLMVATQSKVDRYTTLGTILVYNISATPNIIMTQ